MPFTPEQIIEASRLIEERVGLAIYTQMRGTLEDILIAQASENPRDYLNALRDSAETSPIWQALLDALTIGETYFLRDRTHFQVLRQQILPQLIADRRNSERLEINLWSAGCATGEEPYSLAITLHELLPDIDKWKINLIGTDINGKALQTAQRGVYRKWAFRHTDSDFQTRYFDPVPDGLQIKPHIRNKVIFRHANILEPTIYQFDVILCRNVMLYFGVKHSKQAEIMFFNTLSPGGWLLLGQAEAIHYTREFWTTHLYEGAPIYQKPIKPAVIHPVKQQEAKPTPHINDSDDENLLRQLIFQRPDHVQAYILLANSLANRQQFLEAHKQIDTALEIDPLAADGYYLRAVLHLEEGDTQAARKSLREALYCRRDHPLAAFLLGNIYAQEGEEIQAKRQWRNASQSIANLKPDVPVSEISNITVAQLNKLLSHHLQN